MEDDMKAVTAFAQRTQSLWLDLLAPGCLDQAGRARLARDDAVASVRSNPSSFE